MRGGERHTEKRGRKETDTETETETEARERETDRQRERARDLLATRVNDRRSEIFASNKSWESRELSLHSPHALTIRPVKLAEVLSHLQPRFPAKPKTSSGKRWACQSLQSNK